MQIIERLNISKLIKKKPNVIKVKIIQNIHTIEQINKTQINKEN